MDEKVEERMRDTILVVDDEETLCEALQFNLEVAGYEVDVAYSAEEAMSKDLRKYSLILLDVMMGEMNGFRMAKAMKDDPELARIPIIFCTAKDTEDDVVTGFNIGADDYISKPYSIRTVLARVKAVLKRTRHSDSAEPENGMLTFRGLSVDTALKRVFVDGEEVKLPRKEYEILHLLLTHRGRIFSRAEIIARVWPEEVVVMERVVDVNMTRLRYKLGDYGKYIVTRVGYGYGFHD